jgi:2-oxoisovalerate dehydrogenase E1 component alpha subunit
VSSQTMQDIECRWYSRALRPSETAPEHMEFPGGHVPFTALPRFVGGPGTATAPLPCYRTIDASGREVPECEVPHPFERPTAVRVYSTMVSLQTVDTIFYEAQRQGRFSFYMTSSGEEATAVGSAAALMPEDVVFTQYREQGVLMWRGFTPAQMADQCYGNEREQGKGRQMPIHYGSKEFNFHTISSPLGTQLPHAVGAAYALKVQGRNAVAVAYFGEGAASEGDFHAAMNFAATLSCPVVFICRNNGWAISTPASEQYRGDGIAGRGPSYGVATIRVDGGDAQALYSATAQARSHALQHSAPVLIEAMSYRVGHHSTSDDSSRYRAAEEMRAWRARDPVGRLRAWLESKHWWDEGRDKELRAASRKEAIQALEAASKASKPTLSEMFTDVYDVMPLHLQVQRDEVLAHVRMHPEVCPADMPVDS